MKYSIIIPTYNHLEDCLKPCIESIIKNTILDNIEVIIVANGCKDGTEEYVKSLGNSFKLVLFKEPMGYTRSVNEGIKVSSGDYLLLLNNDCVILDWGIDTWINILKDPFTKEQNIGITGVLKRNHPPTGIDFLLFFCVMIKKEIIQKVGLLDEIFNPGYGEDIDYCQKIANAGYEVRQVPVNGLEIGQNGIDNFNFPIWHKSSQTVHGVPGWEDIVIRNENILSKRYSVPKLLSKLKEENLGLYQEIFEFNFYNAEQHEIKDKVVLDIGANRGYFSIYASINGAKKVYAFEPAEIYKKLVSNTSLFNNILTQQKAIFKPGKKEVSIQYRLGYNDLCTLITDKSELEENNIVDCISLEEAIRDIPDNDLVMKIDCEGSEYDILFNTSDHVFNRIKYIYAEFHNELHSNKEYNYDMLESFLISKGYSSSVSKRANVAVGEWRQDINGNLTFTPYPQQDNPTLKLYKFTRNDTNKKYSIIIPTYNNIDYLKKCIESIKNTTDLIKTEIIIVANGCADGTEEYVKSLGEPFKLLQSKEALGYPKAINLGLIESKGEYVVLLNNDTVILSNAWIDLLEKPFSKNTSVGITGPILNRHEETKYLWFAFFCVMIKKEVFKKIGLLNEEFGVGSFEDIDFCIRAQLNGYILVAASKDPVYDGDPKKRVFGQFPIFHEGGATVTRLLNWNEIINKNEKILLDIYKEYIKK